MKLTSEISIHLDAILARAEAATPGPWEVTHREPIYSSRAPRNIVGPKGSTFQPGVMATCIAAPHIDSNATFIAAARSDVPQLVKALQKAKMRDMDTTVETQKEVSMSPLGQTPEIVAWLRKRAKNRAIRFLQRVDCFTGQHPKQMLVSPKSASFPTPESMKEKT